MTHEPTQAGKRGPAPPPALLVTALIRWVLGALLGTGALLAVLMALVNRPEWWRGLFAAALVSVLAALGSMPLLAVGLKRGLSGAVAGYFIAAGARLVVSLGGGVVAVKIGQYPALPTLALMVVFYFALLAAETAVVTRAIWSAKA